MTVMKAMLEKALKKSGHAVEVEVAADLIYIARTEVLNHILRVKTPVIKAKLWNLTDGKCAHVSTVFNTADGTIDHVRCEHPALKGWLCPNHEWQLLTKRATTSQPRERDYNAEAVDSVIRTEARALAVAPRESYGLIKKIQWVKGVRMKTDPDSIKVSEPIPTLTEPEPVHRESRS